MLCHAQCALHLCGDYGNDVYTAAVSPPGNRWAEDLLIAHGLAGSVCPALEVEANQKLGK